jgi:hypothetical protein
MIDSGYQIDGTNYGDGNTTLGGHTPTIAALPSRGNSHDTTNGGGYTDLNDSNAANHAPRTPTRPVADDDVNDDIDEPLDDDDDDDRRRSAVSSGVF